NSASLGGTNLYNGVRNAPDLVAPASATSTATPLVSGVAAMLIGVAHSNPGLSLSTVTSAGQTLQSGETAPVIKALLMAGADRDLVTARNSYSDTYTLDTANNLDSRYGAGAV